MPHVDDRSDSQPGVLPDIRSSGHDVTYVMAPPGTKPGSALVVRCDESGNAWISLRPERVCSPSASANSTQPLGQGLPARSRVCAAMPHARLRKRRWGGRRARPVGESTCGGRDL